jgi:hypoxanthine phosphoribosyltransferase
MSRRPVNGALPDICDRVLVDEASIGRRVAELGAQIAVDFAGEDLRLITVLKGGLFFLADLCRACDAPLAIDFLAVSQYSSGVGGMVRVTKDLSDDIDGASVVLVEDVVDTGLTVNYVLSLLRAHGPARLEVCALIDKPSRRIADVPIAYTGFTLPDHFVVGYGLDLNGRYRNLPFVASLKDEEVFS